MFDTLATKLNFQSRTCCLNYTWVLEVAFVLFFQDGFFMSAAGTTFDALGLVNQIREQNAPTLEEAHELLESGSLQNQCSEENSDKENIGHIFLKREHVSTNQPSKIMVRKIH